MNDATRRALRTLIQGAIAVGIIAICTTLLDSLTPGQPIDGRALLVACIQAAITAVAAFAQRRLEARRTESR